MANLEDVRSFLAEETGLAVVSTTREDGRVLSSVVNCGVIDHPVTGNPCVALVSRGNAARLAHVRRGSSMTVAIRRGWSWVAATGPVDLIGPDGGLDARPDDMDADAYRLLLREIYQAAGGQHDDYDEYDQAMVEDARVAVLVDPADIRGVTPS